LARRFAKTKKQGGVSGGWGSEKKPQIKGMGSVTKRGKGFGQDKDGRPPDDIHPLYLVKEEVNGG